MRLILLLVLAALPLAACGGSGHSHDGAAAIVESTGSATPSAIVPAVPMMVGGLALPNAADGGRAFRLHPPAGDILLVFFGFTHCTDVCPMTMADLRAAVRRLPAADRDRVHVAFATVDPARDTDAVLAGYVRSFFPQGIALRTADDPQLRKVATAFSVAYEVHGTDVQHSALVSAVTPNGRIAVQWPSGTPVPAIAADLQMLLAAVSPS